MQGGWANCVLLVHEIFPNLCHFFSSPLLSEPLSGLGLLANTSKTGDLLLRLWKVLPRHCRTANALPNADYPRLDYAGNAFAVHVIGNSKYSEEGL